MSDIESKLKPILTTDALAPRNSPVFESQAAFRALMMALAEPGTIQTVPEPAKVVPGLSSAMSALALALLDFETYAWIDPEAPNDTAAYLRFHTGAQITENPLEASFALIVKSQVMARLDTFATGTLEYPDRSTTLLIDVETLSTAHGWRLSGPGIPKQLRLAAGPFPKNFGADVVHNHSLFPCGVDLVFCHRTHVAAIPRSTHVVLDHES